MTFVTSNDASLHCMSAGEGQTLVLCHGLVFGSIASWYFSIAPHLSQRFRVILYDQRGHGKSTLTQSGYSVAAMSDDLDAVINHYVAPDEAVTLIGHSYGALIALHYALRNKQRIKSLVLIDAPLPAGRYVYSSIAELQVDGRMQELLSAHIGLYRQSHRQEQRARRRLEYLFLHSSLCHDIESAGDVADDELRALDIPVLCVYGRQSDCAAAGERLAAVLPNAQLHWLDCGHYVAQEVPMQLLQVLDRFDAMHCEELQEAVAR